MLRSLNRPDILVVTLAAAGILMYGRKVAQNSGYLAIAALDDGNMNAGDGCSATCAQESGFTCTGTMPSVCTTPRLTVTSRCPACPPTMNGAAAT